MIFGKTSSLPTGGYNYSPPDPVFRCVHCDDKVKEDDCCERCDDLLCDSFVCRKRHMEWHAEECESV